MINLNKDDNRGAYTFSGSYEPYKETKNTWINKFIFCLIALVLCFVSYTIGYMNGSYGFSWIFDIKTDSCSIDSCDVYITLKNKGWEYSEELSKDWKNKLDIERDRVTGNNIETFFNVKSNEQIVFSKRMLGVKELEKLRSSGSSHKMLLDLEPDGRFDDDLYNDILKLNFGGWIITRKDNIETWRTIQNGYDYKVMFISKRSADEILDTFGLGRPSSSLNYYRNGSDITVDYDSYY